MGLDMYFEKVKIVDGYSYRQIMNAPYYVNGTEEDLKEAYEWFGLTKEDIDKIMKSEPYCIEVAYFRKFNALHRWMVEHVQDGEDDCGAYEVDSATLKELLSTLDEIRSSAILVNWREVNYELPSKAVEEIKKYNEDLRLFRDITVAKDLMPTQEGFFFGGTLYDEYYLECIDDALEQLSKVSINDDEALVYSSSW